MSKQVKKTIGTDAGDVVPSRIVSEKEDADERRLFYVALTRAKESVTITYAKEDVAHRETLPSKFIEEIRSELIEDVATEEWEEKFKNDKGFVFIESGKKNTNETKRVHSLKDREFVCNLFETQGLSPTALNNYLECPWKYFYQNLIRIPSAQNVHQMYGIAVHGALQDFFKRMKEEDSTKEFLLESYKGHLYRLPIAPIEIESLLMKGKKALSGWFDAYEGKWESNVLTEFRIAGVLLYGKIKLTGVLDKLELVDGSVVNVVDYKTGKSKTRNELEGKTKNADGNYYRQLVFYKLLLSLFNDGKYFMQSGIIDFIEPDDKGKYHREKFEINDTEVEELKEKIQTVADEITSLSFWEKQCDEKECEFCALRALTNA